MEITRTRIEAIRQGTRSQRLAYREPTRLSKLPVGTVGDAPLSKEGVALSGGLCGSALACCFGAGVTGTALGLDVPDFAFGVDRSTGLKGPAGASLLAT
jgi:hypothetical protein